MFFFPQDELKRNQAKNIFEVIVEKEGMEFLGWARSTGTSGCAWKSCSRVYAMHHAGIYQAAGKVEKELTSTDVCMWYAVSLSRAAMILM